MTGADLLKASVFRSDRAPNERLIILGRRIGEAWLLTAELTARRCRNHRVWVDGSSYDALVAGGYRMTVIDER